FPGRARDVGALARLCGAVGLRPPGLGTHRRRVRRHKHRPVQWRTGLGTAPREGAEESRMSGGQQGGTTYQTSTSSSESAPPSAIEGALKNLSQQRFQYFLDHPNAPAYYPGSTVADFSPETSAAIGALNQRGYGSPFKAATEGLAGDTLGGKFLDIRSNPYFQDALSAAYQPQNKMFMNSVVPSIASMFTGAGRTSYDAQPGSGEMNLLGQTLDS